MLSIAVVTLLSLFGIFVTYAFQIKLLLEQRVAVGLLVGFIWFGYLMFGLSLLLGEGIATNIIFALITFAIIVNLVKKQNLVTFREELKEIRGRFHQSSWRLFWLTLSLIILIFGYLASQLMIYKNGSYFVQPIHAYGDISLHLSIISSFAYGTNYPPQSPILSGSSISYPFMVDYITSLFVNPLGLYLENSVALTGILFMTIVIINLAYFSYTLTKNKLAAILTIFLVFLNGGLGFLLFFQDVQKNADLIGFIKNLPMDYTSIKDQGYWWINSVLAMFLPQRSFLLGFPVAILILQIFWNLVHEFKLKSFIFTLVLIALLPLIHTHSLFAISILLLPLGVFILYKNLRNIFLIVILSLISLAITYLLSLTFLQQSQSFTSLINWHTGWMSHGEDLLSFFWKNFGIILFVLPVTLFLGIKSKLSWVYLILISQVWFILPSLVIFQPWDFDNIKLFIYWYILSSILIGFYLSKLLVSKNTYTIFLGGLIFVIMIFSGSLDIWRLLNSSGTRYEIYSPQAIRVAQFIKNNTKKDAVFLSIDKYDNPAISLAGRKAILGYKTWAWSYGLDYLQRDQDKIDMLSGNGDDLFAEYKITNIILFDNEQSTYFINEEKFRKEYKLIYSKEGYKIYEI